MVRVRGFTLLELMVAVLLIGIGASLVVMSIGPGKEVQQLELEVNRFAGLLRLAEQRAVLGDQLIGLSLEAEQYQFVKYFSMRQRWLNWNEGAFAKLHPMPPGVEMEWALADDPWSQLKKEGDSEFSDDSLFPLPSENPFAEDDKDKEKDKAPVVTINSSGDVTPFSINFFFKDGRKGGWKISVDDFGKVMVKRADNSDS